jgi:general secretion pathway protein L
LAETPSEATWIALDSDGHPLAQANSGPLEEATPEAEGRRVILLVDGLSVITTSANLPAKGQARILKMLPYSLEDVVAEDVENLLFCPGARGSDGAVAVAIVARERMDRWISECDQAGLSVNLIYADTEGVPDTPGNMTFVLERNRIYGRSPGQQPFVLDDFKLSDVLEVVGTEESDASSRHVVIYADEAGYAHREAEIDALRERVSSVELQVLAEGPTPRFGATLINEPGCNLLQGDYAPKSNWSALVRPWRVAAMLLLGLSVLATLTEGVRFYALSQQDQALSSQLATGCQRTFQSPQIAACRSEIQRRLAASGESSTGESGPIFLATLVAVAEARDPASRIEALSFRNGVTDLRIIAPDVTALDGFARDVARSGRFQVNIQSANPGTEGVEGRLQVLEAAQ